LLETEGEGGVEKTSRSRLTESVISRFLATVQPIFGDQQRGMKKELLCFSLGDLVLVGVFPLVSCIPVKTGDPPEINHLCILS